MTTLTRTGCVRRFGEDDITEVARLHQKIFQPSHGGQAGAAERYSTYFRRVFLDNPVRDAALPSLVYEDSDRRIRGFLGVVPREMRVNGRRYQAAVSSQFIVDPDPSAGLVAVRLAKAFLDGPQDLAVSDEATDVSRRIWEGLGGATSLVHSLHWTRPLRPARLALSFVRARRTLAAIAAAAAPLAGIVDAFAAPALSRLAPRATPLDELPVDEEEFSRCHGAFAETAALHVEYDGRSRRWLLDRARERRPNGELRLAALRNGGAAGWYVYHLEGGSAEVLHVAATPPSAESVLAHLFADARARGAVAVHGRVEPRLLQALADAHCVFHRRGPWMLIHARRAELLHHFHNGTASFSRLDGEWCLGF
jgi:hypothetical protein